MTIAGFITSHNLYYVKCASRKAIETASEQSYMIPFPFTDPMISS